jgi:hypothetical protein
LKRHRDARAKSPPTLIMNTVVFCAATRTETHLLQPYSDRCQLVQCGARDIAAVIEPALALSPAGLVSFGFAGGLAPGLRTGTILLPQRLRTADGGFLQVDARWRDAVAATLDPVSRVEAGDLLETRHVVTTPAARRSLHAATGAAAVDMESAKLAALAASAGVPFLAFRAVLDTANDTLPLPVAAIPDGAGNIRWRALLGAMASHPAAMLYFTRAYRRAARALRTALDVARPALFPGAGPCHASRGEWSAGLAE